MSRPPGGPVSAARGRNGGQAAFWGIAGLPTRGDGYAGRCGPRRRAVLGVAAGGLRLPNRHSRPQEARARTFRGRRLEDANVQGTIRRLLEQVVSRVTDGQFLGVGDGKRRGAPRLSVGLAATPEDGCCFPRVARTRVDGFERVSKAVGVDRRDGDREVGYWRTADREKTPSRESRHAR